MSENIIQKELIKQLADLLKENNLSEIEWSKGDLKIKVGKNNIFNTTSYSPSENFSNEEPLQKNSVNKDKNLDKYNTITSPMVGTAYLAPEPGGKKFVEVGDSISEGQQLLIIEAMKTMNPIVSNKNGKIVEILVKDGSPVEFDEPLVIVE
ncbi:MAG: Biotin carboxyl carrier protein of acetyl-CoA carboxylase [Alphaproteobacteria bacterium MarineAlpha2_Bin1]|nr:MAG: Biotin carboxyl carrier protein of acetyl-CoA carboxylase [Alphaproteobacteria bacterium MarineAlpha2_Bin1]|tara:strand:- start:441 stop:893 length:453 start_codon:yes stop_codon:yes gene_type:complete